MKKTILVIALALILAVVLAGCSVNDAVSIGDGGSARIRLIMLCER